MRPLCTACHHRPVAINYHKDDRVFYRRKCETCSRNATRGAPCWYLAGYRQKDFCEKCGFASKHREIFNVYHIDENLKNCRPSNLKTICANCQRILHRHGEKWRQGDLVPDL